MYVRMVQEMTQIISSQEQAQVLNLLKTGTEGWKVKYLEST